MKNNLYKAFKFAKITLSAFAWVTGLLVICSCSGNEVAGGTTEDAGIVAITDRVVSGVSQKGPFLVGSSVTIQELNGRTFDQTGKSFKSSVKSDKGDFVIKGVNLASQYALLEVNGYYRNEVTGEKSGGMITLNALTNLRDRDHVNVNLLTHLTTERILNLVQKEGMSFGRAKKQAEKEVLKSFGIMGDMGNSEDLDLFTGEDGAALLAISILMQGDGSEADLSERIAYAAMSFADSGSWEDRKKAEMADWAFSAYVKYADYKNNPLSEIRENVKSLNDGDSIPPFEEYIYGFWANEFGLGACNEKNDGEIRTSTNELSKFYRYRFYCPGNGHWQAFYASDDKENFVYRTVDMGGAWLWMGENLRSVNDSRSVCYGGEKSNCVTYGMLYTRDEAVDACPEGFELPTFYDAQRLLKKNGGSSKMAAKRLQEMDGFGALNGGWFDGSEYEGLDEMGVFWLSSVGYENGGYFILKIDTSGARIEYIENQYLLWEMRASVRCVAHGLEDSDYRTADIGDKTWMAEDVNFNMYSWDEALSECPEGWHLPSWSEWNDLLLMMADSSQADNDDTEYFGVGPKLWKDVYEDYEERMIVGPDNLYGFSIELRDCRDVSGYSDNRCAFFWTSTDASMTGMNAVNASKAFLVRMRFDGGYSNTYVEMSLDDKENVALVRCVKD